MLSAGVSLMICDWLRVKQTCTPLPVLACFWSWGSWIQNSGNLRPYPAPPSNGKRDLKAEAMSSPAVQAVLDVFPGEVKDVEEL